MRSILAGCVGLFLRISEEKNKGEFAKMLESGWCEVLEGDKRAVCDTCRYRVEKSWKGGMSI